VKQHTVTHNKVNLDLMMPLRTCKNGLRQHF